MKKLFLTLEDFILEKKFGEVHPQNQWVELSPEEIKQWKDNIFDLITIAYKPIGGHSNIKSPDDILDGDIDVFKGIDIDDDEEIDVVRFAKNKRAGRKSVGVGHDGEKQSKKEYINSLINDLKNSNFFVEVSDKIAQILLSKGVDAVNKEDKIRKVIKKPDIEFHGFHPKGEEEDPSNTFGWYTRGIGGSKHTKILLGNPKV